MNENKAPSSSGNESSQMKGDMTLKKEKFLRGISLEIYSFVHILPGQLNKRKVTNTVEESL